MTLSSRQLLSGLGIGQWNATAIVPYLMIAPATTDPKSAQVILMVSHLQEALYAMGATDVVLSGRLDQPTGLALEQIVGSGWERMPWSSNIAAVLSAQGSGMRIRPDADEAPSMELVPAAVGGPLDFLPSVPGGVVTYAAGAYLLYRMFTKRSR